MIFVNGLPAIFGYVVGDHETTTRFLRDWRATINDLFTNKFYGRMAKTCKRQRSDPLLLKPPQGMSFLLIFSNISSMPMCRCANSGSTLQKHSWAP